MSSFSGRFVTAHGTPGQSPSGLVGPGVVEVGPQGLVVETTRRRERLIRVVATLVAIVAMLVFVIATVLVLDEMRIQVDDLRLPAVLGIVVLGGAWVGTEALLGRVLPPARVRFSLAWSFVVSIRPLEDRVDLTTTAPELRGLSVFATDRPRALLDAAEAARAR